MAEVEHRFRYLKCGIKDITATRTIFGELIHTKPYSNDRHEHNVRVPLSLPSRETGIFTSKEFENLSRAAAGSLVNIRIKPLVLTGAM
jgi:hypothetical protein